MAKLIVTKPKLKFSAIVMNTLERSVLPILRNVSEDTAEDIRQEIVDGVRDSSFDLAPLSEEYEKRKEESHPGNPILIRTEEYLNSIEVQPIEDDKGNIKGYTIGVRDEEHFSDSGGSSISMIDLAKILEYGSPSRNIPARPHWRPVYQKYRRRTREAAKKISPQMWSDMKKQAETVFKEHLKNKKSE